MKFIDLHTHTFFSDGILSPAELVYRYKIAGCTAVALTDHADYSNMEHIVSSIGKAAPRLSKYYGLDVIAGIELTYIPPADIPEMISCARELGAEIVVVHGETPAENVPPGTNAAACEGRCDILAHPGHITDETAALAAENDVRLELTTRQGHRATNKEVYETALRNSARMVIDTDSHFPEDLMDENKVRGVLDQVGADPGIYDEFRSVSQEIVDNIIRRRK